MRLRRHSTRHGGGGGQLITRAVKRPALRLWPFRPFGPGRALVSSDTETGGGCCQPDARRKGAAMPYGRCVIYMFPGDAEEIIGKARAGILPIFKEQPGFVAYGVM